MLVSVITGFPILSYCISGHKYPKEKGCYKREPDNAENLLSVHFFSPFNKVRFYYFVVKFTLEQMSFCPKESAI